MTLTRGFSLCAAVVAAGVLLHADAPMTDVGFSRIDNPSVGSGSGRTGDSGVRLKTISAHTNSRGASLVIEATEPVAYVATQPDAVTLLVDLRNVVADGVANSVPANGRSPIAAVTIEPAESMAGPTSRVRVSLAEPVAHHIRSDRNAIVIDFDKPAGKSVPVGKDMPVGEAKNVDPIAALGLDGGSQAKLAADTTAFVAQQTGGRNAARAAAQNPQAPQVQPAPPPPATGEQVANTSQKKYGGHPISMDFQGADLRSVLRVFAEESGLNMVLDPAVQGTVDVQLRDVPWDQALDIILRANKLGYVVDGTIVRIAPLSVLADEEAQRRKLSDEQALAGQVQVLTKTLSYAKAEELQALIVKSALSQRGTVQVDPRTNTLIITDLPERLTTANQLLATLDKPQPQVEIEAKIVQANKNFERRLGVQWGFNGAVSPALGNTTNLAFPNSGSLTGQAGAGTTGIPAGTAVNLGVGGATSAVGLALGSVNGAFNLDVALSALETTGNGRILSTPRVTTQNNITAEVAQGTQIPIQVVANNTVTVNFKDAALILKVTPQITAAGTVIMNIALENSQPDFTRAVNGIPPINTQRANTSVLVTDGQTTVIGGVFISNDQYQQDRTPGLGTVPLLRWLFKRDVNTTNDQELLIFITPRIIKG
jgi:type IV pilus assembly protein PilQ